MNRCFNAPYTSDQRRLACALLNKLIDFNPEAVIDGHNTSGRSEPFAIAVSENARLLQLTRLFTRKLVVMDLTLGTLIEQQGSFGPTVTIEFGDVMDAKADQFAEQTLTQFVTREHVFGPDTLPTTAPITLLRQPHRLEIENTGRLRYSNSNDVDADVTIFSTIDQLNFSRIDAGTPIGWPGQRGLNILHIRTAEGSDLVNDYFSEQDGYIVTRQPVILFMATTDPYIAIKDCLMYLAPQE